jgi:hypothetical protein
LKRNRTSFATRVTVSLIGLMLLGGAVFMLLSLDRDGDTVAQRRVWSEEHGHWH